jgi:Class II Aldolase and Adducin N-terminal domain
MTPPPPSAVADNANGLSTEQHTQQQKKVDESTTRASPGKINLPQLNYGIQFKDKYEEREYLKGRLALAFRIFGKLGYEEGVAGHITLRDPVNPNHFWVNPFGTAFRLMKRSDLILVNEKGEVIDGGKNRQLNSAAYMIHHAVHTARPDVICAAHSHSIYGRAFSTLGRNLDITTQDSCAFHDVGVFTCLTERLMQYRILRSTHLSMASCLTSRRALIFRRRSGTRRRPFSRTMAYSQLGPPSKPPSFGS